MQYTFDRGNLHVAFSAQGCDLPADERARLQAALAPLAEAVFGFPSPQLTFNVIFHPNSQVFHVEAKLKVPGRTLTSGDKDPYLDSALQRCLRKLVRRAEDYRDNPDRAAMQQAERREALDHDIVAPEDADGGPVAAAAAAGDYRAFRNALVRYEDWLRLRVGRWVERYPEVRARIGTDILIGDLVEEVYLNAFEGIARRPTDKRFSEWLDSLIDPSIKDMLHHPDDVREAASLARTLREGGVE
jgi:hypothetical protein